MEQNKNTPIRVGDLLTLFVKKIKLLIVIGLIFAILGGAWGGLMDSLSMRYNAVIDISISPADETDVLLYDLRSGSFAEKLLLEKNGLPKKELCDPEDYNAALKALAEYETAREKRLEKYYELSYYYTAPIENKYQTLKNDYNEILERLKLYKAVSFEGLDKDEREHHLQMIQIYEEKLEKAEQAKNTYYEEQYGPAMEKRIQLQTELSQCKDEMELKKREADESVEKVLAVWRKDEEIQRRVMRIMDSVKYEYFASEAQEEEDEAEAAFHKGFIKISISVLNDAKFAGEIVDYFRLHVTDYVERHLEYFAGKVEVDCTIINPIVSVDSSPASLIPGIVKTAVAFGAVAVVLTYLFCVVRVLLKATERKDEEASSEE